MGERGSYDEVINNLRFLRQNSRVQRAFKVAVRVENVGEGDSDDPETVYSALVPGGEIETNDSVSIARYVAPRRNSRC